MNLFPSMKKRCAVRARLGSALVAVMFTGSLLGGGSAKAEIPAVMEQAPSGAQLVAIVPNMAGLNDKIAKLNQSLNLNQPELEDLLGMFKSDSGIEEGVRDDGPLMVVVPNVIGLAMGNQPQILIMTPVSDYGQFVNNFLGEDETLPEDLTEVVGATSPAGEPAYFRKAGDFAVMGPNRALVRSYQPGDDTQAWADLAGPLGSNYLKSGDITMLLDMRAIGMLLQPMVQAGMNQARSQIDPMGQLNPTMREQLDTVLEIYQNIIGGALRDGQSLIASIEMNDQGIGLTYAMQFKENSPSAAYFPGHDGEEPKTMLGTIPDRPYIAAIGSDLRGLAFDQIIDDLLSAMPEGREGGLPMIDTYRESLSLGKQVNAGAWAWLPPQSDAEPAEGGNAGEANPMGAGFMNMIYVSDVDQAEPYLNEVRGYFESMNGKTTELAPAQGNQPPPTMTFKSNVEQGAEEIEGVSLDRFSVNIEMPVETQQQLPPMMMMFGGQMGYEGYMAQADDSTVLMTITMNQDLISSVLQNLDGDGGLVQRNELQRIREHVLPPGGVAEAYVSIQGIGVAANPFMVMFGMDPIEFPEDLAPLGVGVGVQEGGLAYRTFLPMDTLEFAAEKIQSMQEPGAGMGQQQPQQDGAQPAPF